MNQKFYERRFFFCWRIDSWKNMDYCWERILLFSTDFTLDECLWYFFFLSSFAIHKRHLLFFIKFYENGAVTVCLSPFGTILLADRTIDIFKKNLFSGNFSLIMLDSLSTSPLECPSVWENYDPSVNNILSNIFFSLKFIVSSTIQA